MARLVGQPWGTCDIADGVEARHACGPVGSGDHVGLLDLHAQTFEAEVLDIADDADGDDGALGLQGFTAGADLDLDRDAIARLGQFLDARPDAELQAAALEGLAGGGRDLLVLGWQDARQGLDHHHLGAERAVEAGELDADGARADDDQRLRRGLRNHGLAIGPDAVAVRLQSDLGNRARPCAGGQDDMLGLEGAAPAPLLGDDDLGRRRALFQLGRTFNHLDLVLAHQEADAGVQLGGDLARAFDDLAKIEARLVGGQAVVAQVMQLLVDLAGLQQGLGRDAAPVQADAAQGLALHNGGLEAQLGGADGRDVAAGTGADDDDVEIHSRPPRRSSPGVLRSGP